MPGRFKERRQEKIILLAIEDITEKKKLEREVLKAKDIAEVATASSLIFWLT